MDKFNSGSRKIQSLASLYSQLDSLPNRRQWWFEPNYKNYGTAAFMFSHSTIDGDKRSQDLNLLAAVLFHAGIKCNLRASDGIIQDVEIAPEYSDLARKLFARYQSNSNSPSHTTDLRLEQEWLAQRQK